MRKLPIGVAVIIALCTLGLIAPAYANMAGTTDDAIFTPGNNSQPDEHGITFPTSQLNVPAVNGVAAGTTVHFSSTHNLTGSGSGISPASGSITNITLTVPLHTFSDFIFNAISGAASPGLTVTVLTNMGTFNHSFGVPGNNFLTITTSPGEKIDSVRITSTGGIALLNTLNISGLEVVPEPSTLLLFGSGLLLCGIVVVRRKQRGLIAKA